MKRKILLLLIAILNTFIAFSQETEVHFPYFISLQGGTTPPPGLYLPEPSKNNAKFTEGGLQLTEASMFKFGAILMKDMAFNSDNGIEVNFEFNIYDGLDVGTDGIIMFLYDGAIPDSEMFMGATGRSMGYVFNRANEPNKGNRQKGMPGAYLGVALNVTGNFKSKHLSPDVRINGINYTWPKTNTIEGANHVTLRGAELKLPDSDPMQGYRGYPVLKTVSTIVTNSQTNGSAELKDDGTYSFGPSFSQSTSINLRNAGIAQNENDPKFRKAFISLIPHPEGGFNVTVKVQHGNKISTIIENYHYKTKLTYYENAEALGGDNNILSQNTTDVRLSIDAVVPKTFKVGFAGITGGRTSIHMIRNLLISLPYSAEAADIISDACNNSTSIFDPYEGDIAYGGHISNPSASKDNIDKTTFQFTTLDGKKTTDPYKYQDNYGIWEYDLTTAKIHFKPTNAFKNTNAQIRYTFKGKGGKPGEPYNDEKYRSNPALITLSSKECPVYVNPNIKVKTNK